MAPTKPTPLTWTIRFKNGKSTILLHVEPSQSLGSVKSELLNALRQRNPNGNLNGAAIPEQANDVLLARQIDSANPDKGWTRLDEADLLEEGPATKKRKTSEKDNKNRSVDTNFKSLGLNDGAVLAFKFANEEEEEEDEGLGLEDENWNVELPAYDDALAAGLMNGEEEESP
ncbi:MAG: hypothetical protein M1831_005723 [Alyxoria varia]|nr:MAG: hypothetical protein M1831_005723 [Alyxoria varia]